MSKTSVHICQQTVFFYPKKEGSYILLFTLQGRLGGLQEELNTRASSALTFLQRQSDAEQPMEAAQPDPKASGSLFGAFARGNR